MKGMRVAGLIGVVFVLASFALAFAAIWVHDNDTRTRLAETAFLTGAVGFPLCLAAFLAPVDR